MHYCDNKPHTSIPDYIQRNHSSKPNSHALNAKQSIGSPLQCDLGKMERVTLVTLAKLAKKCKNAVFIGFSLYCNGVEIALVY